MPLLDSTKGMINKAAIEEMKDGVVLLNYARDLLVDEDAVLAALKAGKMQLPGFINEDCFFSGSVFLRPRPYVIKCYKHSNQQIS